MLVYQKAHVDVCASVCAKTTSPLKFQLTVYGCSDIISPVLIWPNGARGAISTAASTAGSPT